MFRLCLLFVNVLPALHSAGLSQQQAPYVSWIWKESMCCSLMFVLRDSSAGSYECKVSFFGSSITAVTTEEFFLLYLFVVMTEVVGRMLTSGGVRAGSVLYFPLAFVKSRASHVACFCFS